MNDVLARVKLVPVVRALALISQGKTKTRACEIVGISVDTLDDRLRANPLVVSEFLIEQRGKLHSQYEEVIEARAAMLKDFIAKANDPKVSTKTKLSIDARLKEMQESMEIEMGLVGNEEENPLPGSGSVATDAETFVKSKLAGPALRRGVGKATLRETTIEFSLTEKEEQEPETLESKFLDNDV